MRSDNRAMFKAMFNVTVYLLYGMLISRTIMESIAISKNTWRMVTKNCRDFPGGPVVKTPHLHCRGHGFDPLLGN